MLSELEFEMNSRPRNKACSASPRGGLGTSELHIDPSPTKEMSFHVGRRWLTVNEVLPTDHRKRGNMVGEKHETSEEEDMHERDKKM